MQAVHAELVRLATELEVVKGQVQTECNALRDLFARTTTAMSSSGPQHDRRLNHREAGRHLAQQLGGSRLDYGDFAFRMERYAAVLSRDGQGVALLRERISWGHGPSTLAQRASQRFERVIIVIISFGPRP